MSQFGVSSILLQTTAPPFLCANSAFGNVMWVLGAYGIKAFFLKKMQPSREYMNGFRWWRQKTEVQHVQGGIFNVSASHFVKWFIVRQGMSSKLHFVNEPKAVV